MRVWLLMLSGLLVWALHFAGVYGIASVFDVMSEAGAPASRWTVAAFSALCLAADAAILLLVLRLRRRDGDDPVRGWVLSIAGLGAAISFVSILCQGLPAAIGH